MKEENEVESLVKALEIIEGKKDTYFYEDVDGTSVFVDRSKRERIVKPWCGEKVKYEKSVFKYPNSKTKDIHYDWMWSITDKETQDRASKHCERVQNLEFRTPYNPDDEKEKLAGKAFDKRYEEFVKTLNR